MSAAVQHGPGGPGPAPAGEAGSVMVRRGMPDRGGWLTGRQWILRLLSPLVLIGLWELLSRLGPLDPRFFPPPSVVALAGFAMLRDGSLLGACVDTLWRMVAGFSIGALAGIAVGLWLGLSRWSRALLEPWILITYPVPKLAVYPLIVLIVGLGDTPIIILLAIAVFYIVVINSIAGVLAVRPVVFDVAKECRASFTQSFLTVALPASMPHIFTGLEIALGIAYVLLVAAEFIGAKTGLGSIIWSSWQLFDVAPMYVAITTVSLLGYLSVISFRALGDLVMPWRHQRP